MRPGRVVMAIGAAHGVWGSIAYRKPLADILRAGVVDTIGDGIFNKRHSGDERAAAFWFMFVTPMAGLIGYLVDSADARAQRVAGGTLAATGVAGTLVVPRSGFPMLLPVGFWMARGA